uniref:ATP synthase F0 subunit 8 n=1 Tax=Chaetopleura apiculata TaxID=58794 RepID=A0A343S5A0_CHAAP|nr:ATP synthase F0 subunit 8 [Chaetopleura apiculata]
MPQLAPLNWVFLECFFWSILVMILISFWWWKDKKYAIYKGNKNICFLLLKNKWAW